MVAVLDQHANLAGGVARDRDERDVAGFRQRQAGGKRAERDPRQLNRSGLNQAGQGLLT